MRPEAGSHKRDSLTHKKPHVESDLVIKGLNENPLNPYYFACYDGPYEVASHSYQMVYGTAVYSIAQDGKAWLYGVVSKKREEPVEAEPAPAKSGGKGKFTIPFGKKPAKTKWVTYLAAGQKMRELVATAKAEKK